MQKRLQHGKNKYYFKVDNKYWKFSYCINQDAIKESKVSNTKEIFENDDTLSYIDKMYEEVGYKALKEKLLDSKVDIHSFLQDWNPRPPPHHHHLF